MYIRTTVYFIYPLHRLALNKTLQYSEMVEKAITECVNIIRLIYLYVTKGNEKKIITSTVKKYTRVFMLLQ